MIQRSLNIVDARLVDHGLRVGAALDAMLEAAGWPEDARRCEAYQVALLHDIGAYRTEEIDRMAQFETDNVWEHSFYGYLFFKELSPLPQYAEVVLYHHMPNEAFTNQDEDVRFLSQALQVADRVDVLLLDDPQIDADEVMYQLTEVHPGRFSEDAIQLFCEAERRFGVLAMLRAGVREPDARRLTTDSHDTGAAAAFLDTLVHVIDFRSRHTVTHTVTTAWVAYELARRMLSTDEASRVYCAALLHDLGKIGIPLSILEKPGRLDDDEMAVMKTHVALTEDILAGCVSDDIATAGTRHHEKLDGTGYPRGLVADQLEPADRIIAVADIVSALVGTRSYKVAYPKDKVLSLLREQGDAGKVDRAVVDIMARDYDVIMNTVREVCRPVAAVYARVQDEYQWLLDELSRVQGGRA